MFVNKLYLPDASRKGVTIPHTCVEAGIRIYVDLSGIYCMCRIRKNKKMLYATKMFGIFTGCRSVF